MSLLDFLKTSVVFLVFEVDKRVCEQSYSFCLVIALNTLCILPKNPEQLVRLNNVFFLHDSEANTLLSCFDFEQGLDGFDRRMLAR